MVLLRRRIALEARLILRVLLGNMLRSISILSLSLIGEFGVCESGVVWINLRLIGESGVWINLRVNGESGVWIGESGAAKVLLGLSIYILIFVLISGKPKVRFWPSLLIHNVLIGTRGRKLVLTGHVLAYHLDLLLISFDCLMIACSLSFL